VLDDQTGGLRDAIAAVLPEASRQRRANYARNLATKSGNQPSRHWPLCALSSYIHSVPTFALIRRAAVRELSDQLRSVTIADQARRRGNDSYSKTDDSSDLRIWKQFHENDRCRSN
jgi:hypothetical protein